MARASTRSSAKRSRPRKKKKKQSTKPNKQSKCLANKIPPHANENSSFIFYYRYKSSCLSALDFLSNALFLSLFSQRNETLRHDQPQGEIGWKYEPQTQPHPPLIILAKAPSTHGSFFTNTHGMREESGLRSALVDLIFFSFFSLCLFILLFTLMVCCDGNSLVKTRRNGKQRMEESDHQDTDKGGCFAFCLISFPGRSEYGAEELDVYDYIGCICDGMSFHTSCSKCRRVANSLL